MRTHNICLCDEDRKKYLDALSSRARSAMIFHYIKWEMRITFGPK